jgi:uncharacterized RDD family membrane protein YckC
MEANTFGGSEIGSATHIYASISRRFAALLLDGLILTIPAAVGAHLIPVVGGIVVWFFYAPLMEASALRATLGKHLMGIQVCDELGRRISLRAAVIRNLLKAVSSVLLFLGFIVALFSNRKQTLHDMVADTFVVYGRSDAPVVDTWVASVKELFNAGDSNNGASGIPNGAPSLSDVGPNGQAASTVAELERLQALREKGALTEEEFQLAKRKILGV